MSRAYSAGSTASEIAARAGANTRDTLARRAGRAVPSTSDRMAGAIVREELLRALAEDLATARAGGRT